MGNVIYHVINRGVGRWKIFYDDGDYLAFEKALAEAHERVPVRIIAYCLMGNHFHLLLWPRADGDLRRFMQWLTVTHTRRWHAHHGKMGQGALYQGRYKSFPVQRGEHLLKVGRYVERNALRAGQARSAQAWAYCSLNRRGLPQRPAWLLGEGQWPVARFPADWLERVNEAENAKELEALRCCVNRGQPYGDERWMKETAKSLSLESSLRNPWRPAKVKEKRDEGGHEKRK